MTKELYLLRGLPGSGKTTIAGTIIRGTDGVMFAADDYFVDPNTNDYNFDASKLAKAHADCQARCEDAMKRNISVIVVHNTFTTPKEMRPYRFLADENGYIVHSLIVEHRHEGINVHDVPEEAIARMEQRFSVKLRQPFII